MYHHFIKVRIALKVDQNKLLCSELYTLSNLAVQLSVGTGCPLGLQDVVPWDPTVPPTSQKYEIHTCPSGPGSMVPWDPMEHPTSP